MNADLLIPLKSALQISNCCVSLSDLLFILTSVFVWLYTCGLQKGQGILLKWQSRPIFQLISGNRKQVFFHGHFKHLISIKTTACCCKIEEPCRLLCLFSEEWCQGYPSGGLFIMVNSQQLAQTTLPPVVLPWGRNAKAEPMPAPLWVNLFQTNKPCQGREGGLSSWMNLPIDKGCAVFGGWSGSPLQCLVWCPRRGWC